MKEKLEVSAISNDIQSSTSAETQPLAFVKMKVEDMSSPGNSQVPMRDVGDRGVCQGD